MRRVREIGEASYLIDWPDEPEPLANRKARAILRHVLRAPDPAVLTAVPGAASLLVEFAPGSRSPGTFLARAEAWERDFAAVSDPRRHDIPVIYGGAEGIDLAELAAERGISAGRFVEIHSAATFTVAFLGFAPGFGYLTGLPDELRSTRLATPRASVPSGSVAIGGRFCGIYPASMPGGWRLIGRTAMNMFDLRREAPALLSPGDLVRFVPVGAAGSARVQTRERFGGRSA